MTFARKALLASAIILLGACRSEPVRFHTLLPAHSGEFHSSGAEIRIETLSVPPQVDRQQIVVRQSQSSLAVLESQWWGASLLDEIRSALADQLSSGAGRKMSVRLDVQRFDSVPGQYALIDVKWRLRDLEATDKARITCRSISKTPAGPSIDDVVIAHQNNLRLLAADISQTAGKDSWHCPSRSPDGA